MKMFIPLLCLLSFTIAEPPVGDSYATAKSSHGYEHDDFQRSPSQQYGPPSQISVSRNSLSSEYGLPKSRYSARHSPIYGPPTSRILEEYGVPDSRSASKLPEEYGVTATRTNPSQEYGLPETRNAPSLEYGAPTVRKATSQRYGVPSTRNTLSQKYGVPKSRRVSSQEYGNPKPRKALSEEYGVPSTRNTPSQEYGVPVTRSPSQEYGVPNVRKAKSFSRNIEATNPSNIYGAPRKPSEEYGIPERSYSKSEPSSLYLPQKSSPSGFNDVSSKISFNSRSLSKSSDGLSTYTPKIDSLSYNVPSPSSDYSQEFNNFGARLSNTHGVPSRASEEYDVPRAADLKTNAVASSYSSPRSSLSSTYGAPSTRDSAPAELYGVPEQYNTRSSQGYDYGRAGDEDLSEPANYDFTYKVNDYTSGSDFGHTESRQENRAEGTYFVVLPDGNKQVVEYEADERGFKPRISVEPAEARSGGYDENAADLTDSSDGPY